MCMEYEVGYSCPDKYCSFTLIAYSTHCHVYKLDGINGTCERTSKGAFRRLSYPCRACNLMSHPNPAVVKLRMRRDRIRRAWLNYPNVGEDPKAEAFAIEAMKKKWIAEPWLYQVEEGFSDDPGSWTEADWKLYLRSPRMTPKEGELSKEHELENEVEHAESHTISPTINPKEIELLKEVQPIQSPATAPDMSLRRILIC